MSKTFLGIGAGPIQCGIFVAGAAQGFFDRIVLADVDPKLVDAIRKNGSITVNTALDNSIRSDVYSNIEIFNPSVPADLVELQKIASEALAINTALPSINFYRFCAPWLQAAFQAAPERTRYVYTSENCTTAAEELAKAVGKFSHTYYLDTVIGKMSKIFSASESSLPPLAEGFDKGHLVEEFNTIYTSSAPEIDEIGIKGLYPKKDIYPFEEAKLYGHNASHFLLGLLAAQQQCKYMSDATLHPQIIELTRQVLHDECAVALCKKFAGIDEYFELDNFRKWADELIKRMTSALLSDSVERVIRDLDRKLSWDDRLIGAIRLCLAQGVNPEKLAAGGKLAAQYYALQTLSEKWPASPEMLQVKKLLES